MHRVIDDETAAVTVEDRVAPSNVPLWYSVVAVRNGARSTRAVTATPSFRRPRVSNVSVQSGDGTVALRWRTPEGASFVEVHRAAGPSTPRPVPADPNGALDEGLSNGRQYQYLLVAVYLYDGQQVRSQAEVIPATPQRPLPQCPPVRVQLAPDDEGMLEVLDAPDDGDSWVLIASRLPPAIPAGREVARSSLSQLGEVLRPQARAGLPPLVNARDADTVFTIVAVDGERARIGSSTVWGPVPTVEGLEAVRRGGQLEVFWYQTRDLRDLSFRVTLANESARLLDQRIFLAGNYDTEWPLRLVADDGPMRLTVTPERILGAGVTCAGTAQIRQLAARPRVRYSVGHVPEGRIRPRPGPAQVTLTLESGPPLTLDKLSITVKPGNIHPLDYEEEAENSLSKCVAGLTLQPGMPVTIALGRGKGRYRVRCFAPGSDVEFLHPPVPQRSIRWPE